MKKKLALLASSAAFSLILFVAGDAIFVTGGGDFRRTPIGPPDSRHDRSNRSDPELLHLRVPHHHWKGTAFGDLDEQMSIPTQYRMSRPIECVWDADGFRNESPLGRMDIAFIGDSFVEQPNLPSEELVPSLVGKQLGKTAINLGQCRYGPQQELVVLKRYAIPRKPTIVVWCFFEGNDLHDAREYERVQPEWQSRWNRSATRNALDRAVNLVSASPPADAAEHGRRHVGILSSGQPLWFAYEPAIDEHALSLVADVLSQAAAACRGAEATLIVAFIPTTFRVYGPLCTFDEDTDCATWTQDDLPERMAGIAGGLEGAVYLDLTTIFREKAEAGSLLYYPDDTHWTAQGHQLAAEAICEAINEIPHALHAR